MNNFLRPADLALMKRDMAGILGSAEAVIIFVEYQAPVGPVTENKTYGFSSPTSWQSMVVSSTAIQKFIHPNNIQIKQWGILDAGDCIFYLPPEVDLSGVPLGNAVVRTGNLIWQTVSLDNRGFQESVEVRIGGVQFFQVLPAKLVRAQQ
jgi:hypothetical protein